ncbi:MAG: hypothetical protein IZT57_04790, partial [Chloroflexi bacterium]|nr:hypothetical protein [Chloroflexota bacterium]
MKTPESGTEVFAPVLGVTAGTTITGFPVDYTIARNPSAGQQNFAFTRMLGETFLATQSTAAESATGIGNQFDVQDGIKLSDWFGVSSAIISWNFKRATGFMDVVAYTGNGASSHALTHNLGVSPELIITKRRDAIGDWRTATNFSASAYSLYKVNEIDGAANINYAAYGMYAAKPTSTTFTVGSGANVNASGGTFVS